MLLSHVSFKKKKKKGIAGQHSREVICEAPCLLRCSYSSGVEWDILYGREMSPSLGSSKPLWERNAPLGPERENQKMGKVCLSLTCTPSSELASRAGRLVEEQKGE